LISISTTAASVLADFLKTSERTVFWDDARNANIDPFLETESGFFAAEWDTKVWHNSPELTYAHK
jgi:hypothetical protein